MCYIPLRQGTVKRFCFCEQHIPPAVGCVEDLSLPYLEEQDKKKSRWDRILPQKPKPKKEKLASVATLGIVEDGKVTKIGEVKDVTVVDTSDIPDKTVAELKKEWNAAFKLEPMKKKPAKPKKKRKKSKGRVVEL